MITSCKLNGLFKCSKFDSLINFQCQYPRCQSLNRHWSILLDQTPLQLDKEGIKKEDGEKGGCGWRLFKGGNYFKYFHLRVKIIRGRRLIEGGYCSRKYSYVKTILLSKQVKRTPQDSINELIIWKMNPLIVPVTSVKFKSELLHA